MPEVEGACFNPFSSRTTIPAIVVTRCRWFALSVSGDCVGPRKLAMKFVSPHGKATREA